jgi:predicted phage terminase large subunit-like protein
MYDCYIRKALEKGHTIFSDIVLTDAEKVELGKKGKDVESLETLKRVMSPLFFSGQIMNDPLADDLVEFKREWVLKFERTPELMKMLGQSPKVLSVDPAFRLNQTNDFSGLVVSCRGKDGFIYILEAKQMKVNPSDLIAEIFKLVDTYKPQKVLVETVAAQVMLLDLLRNKMRDLGKFFTIEETRTSTNETKAMRIRGLIPFYANGQILHAPGLADLEGQLLEFPRGIHDDIIDALSAHQTDWKVVKTAKAKEAEKGGTWNWWMKQPIMGQKRDSNLKQLFGDLLP